MIIVRGTKRSEVPSGHYVERCSNDSRDRPQVLQCTAWRPVNAARIVHSQNSGLPSLHRVHVGRCPRMGSRVWRCDTVEDMDQRCPFIVPSAGCPVSASGTFSTAMRSVNGRWTAGIRAPPAMPAHRYQLLVGMIHDAGSRAWRHAISCLSGAGR